MGFYVLILAIFATLDGPPVTQATIYPSREACQADLIDSSNKAFDKIGGHVDFTAECFFVPRRIGS